MNKNRNKLWLNKTTLRRLTLGHLTDVAGASPPGSLISACETCPTYTCRITVTIDTGNTVIPSYASACPSGGGTCDTCTCTP